MKLTSTFLVASFAFIYSASGTSVNFYHSREDSCSATPGLEYRNLGCSTCVDAGSDWWGVRVFDLAGNQRITLHSGDKCTRASTIQQWYGETCARALLLPIRSVWIACPDQKRAEDTGHSDKVTVEEAF